MKNHLLMCLAASLALAFPAAAQDAEPKVPTVVTRGEAVVRRAPDQARVQLAVETKAKNPKTAASENARVMSAVQARLKALGIAPEAIQTRMYDLQQEFDYVDGKQIPRGYVVRNTIEVRVDRTAQAGDVIDAGIEAGATNVSSIQFDLKDRAGAEREALQRAVADARERANAAAAGAGLSIARILKIEEAGTIAPPPPIPFARTMAMQREAAPDTSVATGQIEIRATVTLTAELR